MIPSVSSLIWSASFLIGVLGRVTNTLPDLYTCHRTSVCGSKALVTLYFSYRDYIVLNRDVVSVAFKLV